MSLQGATAVADHPEILFRAKRFNVERVVQTMPDGSQHVREIARHPGSVIILPLLDDGQICFVRNFRIAIQETLIELPAGTLEPNEDPAHAAVRELAEETGYRAGRIEHKLTFCMSPGILDEQMHFFVAEQLQPGPTSFDEGEDIQPLLCEWSEALAMIRQGKIRDAKTLAALLYHHTFAMQ
jgi:ADP-ribose pyrophosphatase